MRLNNTASLRFYALAASLSFAAGCAPALEPEDGQGELEATEGVASPIVNGTAAIAYPEAALVDMLVDGERVASCSGAVIGPKVVLTAGHCVYGFNGWQITAPFASGQRAKATGAALYDWQVSGENVDPNYHDVALIFLDRPIKLSRYPTIAEKPVRSGSTVVNIGRIQSGKFSSSALFVSKPMRVWDGAASGFPFDYAASEIIQSGDSGGPDMLLNTHTVVAVNSGAGGGSEVLARVDLVSDWIKEELAAHGGAGTSASDGDDSGKPASHGQEVEPNDSYTSSNILAGSLDGTLENGDLDWYTFTLPVKVPYDVSIEASGDAEIRMWKRIKGSYFQVNSTTSTEVAHVTEGAGRYVVVAFSPSGQAQSYTMRLSK